MNRSYSFEAYFQFVCTHAELNGIRYTHYQCIYRLQVQEYKDELIKKAETLIMKGFPQKIVQLNEIMETPLFADRNFQDVYQVRNRLMHKSKIISASNFCKTISLAVGSQHSSSQCDCVESRWRYKKQR